MANPLCIHIRDHREHAEAEELLDIVGCLDRIVEVLHEKGEQAPEHERNHQRHCDIEKRAGVTCSITGTARSMTLTFSTRLTRVGSWVMNDLATVLAMSAARVASLSLTLTAMISVWPCTCTVVMPVSCCTVSGSLSWSMVSCRTARLVMILAYVTARERFVWICP